MDGLQGREGQRGPRSTAAKEIYTESLWGKGNAKSFVAGGLENVSLGTEPEDTANSACSSGLGVLHPVCASTLALAR